MLQIKIKKNEIDNISKNKISESLTKLIDYFQDYMGDGKKVNYLPYRHQYESFKRIMKKYF